MRPHDLEGSGFTEARTHQENPKMKETWREDNDSYCNTTGKDLDATRHDATRLSHSPHPLEVGNGGTYLKPPNFRKLETP